MMKLFSVLMFFLSLPLSAQVITHSGYSDTVPVNNITRGMADSVYTFVASQKNVIEFEDCNICKSRAHIMARAIENRFTGVTVGKAWLFADCKRKSQHDKYKYREEVYLENTGVCRSWGYHVAPVVITANDTFVIDPATQNSAVTLSDWAGKLVPKNGEGFVVIKRKGYFFFPVDDNNLFEDEQAVWYDAGENLLDESYSRSIDEVTRASLGLVEPWRMKDRVKKIKALLGLEIN